MGKKDLQSLINHMKNADPSKIKGVLGFDGFVDEVMHVVDHRIDQDHYERIKYLSDYGQKIIDASGLSLNIEMVPIQRKMGGNGVILANSLMVCGTNLTYIGALGKDIIHEVFEPMNGKVKLISLSDPGFTDAIEFYDGKIISSRLEALKAVNWTNLIKTVPKEKLAKLFDDCQIIGFENWTLVVNATSIWKGILKEVLPLMRSKERKTLFVDLADPQKRSDSDIKEALEYLKEYELHFEVILGLNEKEAYEIAKLYGRKKNEFSSISEVGIFLQRILNISIVVIHPVKTALACNHELVYEVEGPYYKHPKLTTGAGDNFNAGFLLGHLLGFPLKEALLLGTANSGFYVRNARSCNYEELINFVNRWKEECVDGTETNQIH